MTGEHRRSRTGLLVLGAVLLVGSGLLLLTRYLDVVNQPLVLVASYATYSAIGFVLALGCTVVLVVRGPRLLPAIAVVLALAGLVVALRPVVATSFGARPHGAHVLTVMTANVEFGGGSPHYLVAAAAAEHADVAVFEEITPLEMTRLENSGLNSMLPYTAGHPDAAGVNGVVVFSRLPLTTVRPILLGHGGWWIDVGGPHRFTLLAVHTDAPPSDVRRWHRDLATITATARAAERNGPVVVAGDFNATPDHVAFRKVLSGAHLADAAAQAKSSWQPTWPSWFVPVITIDHVLLSRGLVATRTHTYDIPRTDHRALVARIGDG